MESKKTRIPPNNSTFTVDDNKDNKLVYKFTINYKSNIIINVLLPYITDYVFILMLFDL